MADIETTAWSETAASNTAPSPDGWPSLSSPNIVYSTDREMMGALKRWWNRVNPTVTSGGAANAQTLTYGVAPLLYTVGQTYAFIAGFTNSGAMTLNVNGLGAKAVQANGAALVGGELKVGLIIEVAYDGTQFQIIGGTGSGAGAYLPLAGGTLNPGPLNISGAAGTTRAIAGQTAGSNRWVLNLGNTTAEGGSNAGSDFALYRYSDAGTSIDAPLTVTRSTGQVAIKGTSTNDSAAAGFVGEYVGGVVNSPGITLTNSATSNITSISLTAGDWDVSGEAWVTVGTGGATQLVAATTNSSGGLPGPGGGSRFALAVTIQASSTAIATLVPLRWSLTATTTIYLVVLATFASGTCTAYGRIGARRMR